VDQHPHCVLLLDEIEKAHPDLFNILLQVMDHGKLTDHNGKHVDFRNVIIIMTTNAGAADMARPAYGFTRAKREGDDTEAINKLFAPEFRNRLDAVITFAHLSEEVISKVVTKFVMQLEAQLADRNVTIELSDEARDWLVEHGYDESMGARPMGRLIQATIKTPLADDVLFGRLKNGGAVRVIVKTDDLGIEALGFEYPEGPVTPKPEKDVSNAAKKAKPKSRSYVKGKKAPKPKGPGGNGGGGVRTVPKVPLVRA
jgi:ATP-dependent Clp protease ATP-binding subunit ClpA